MTTRPPFVIISGPSGAGEDTVINKLIKTMPLERVITTVTRKKRPGEKDGSPYYFISKKKFEEKIKNKEFFEYTIHYNGNYYGITKQEIKRISKGNKIGVLKIDYQGIKKINKKIPLIISILIKSPLEILEKRIRRRSEVTDKYIKDRMEYTKKWLDHIDIYNYIVENEEGKINKTIEKVSKIIYKEYKLDKKR